MPSATAPASSAVDVRGVLAASATVGVLVYSIIEAPHRGWHSPATVGGFVAAVVLAVVFGLVERRAAHPMLDLSVFRTRAFSGASISATVAFFALFGFIFLVTQYFQYVRGYGPLSTGVRILPVAVAIGAGAASGPLLVSWFGTRAVVTTGLFSLGASFAWISISRAHEPYAVIILQMVLMGAGLGLTQVPATDSILSVLPAAKAGVGSAVNDATREAGGTLGVAIVGSVFASLFASHLGHSAFAGLPGLAEAKTSLGAAYAVAHGDPVLVAVLQRSFMSAFDAGCLVGAAVCWAGALAAVALPGRVRISPATRPRTPTTVAT